MLCQLHRYFGKNIKCYLVSKNLCSNTGHLLVWTKTEIHMQKTRDTFIVSLNEAFWIPGSSETCVLINCIFICRNKTSIKQASIHTNHFSLTSTVQHCHHFRDWAWWQNTENYRLGTESHFLTLYLQLKLVVMLRSSSKESRHFLNHTTLNCSSTVMRWRQLICS